MVLFDISNKRITTLEGIVFPKNITELDCSYNQLTSLEHCPKNLQKLDCRNNQLTSLEHCLWNLQKLKCYNNQLTSLEHCSYNLQILDCRNNQLTSLEYCPWNLQKLYCQNNQLTSLEHCPWNLQELYCINNPIQPIPVYKPETPSLKELSLAILTKFKLEIPDIDVVLLDITKDMYICIFCKSTYMKAKTKLRITRYNNIKIPNWICINCQKNYN